jgi:chorismate mutase
VGRSSAVRGIRGAINVSANSKAEIHQATRELLGKMSKANQVKKEDIASIYFTMTPDLTAAYPATAARELGWIHVPLICAVEIDVPEALPFCIRILMLVNTELSQSAIKHIYLREARALRADLISDNT